MNTNTARRLGAPFAAALLGVLAGALLLGGGLALAQEAPESGVGVAEALAGPNTVNSAAIINGAVTGTDIATGTIGRGDIKVGVVPLWAKIDADETTPVVLAGRGVSSVTKPFAGQFDVTFTRSIETCGWVATRNDNAAGAAGSGEITVEQADSGDPNRVRVRLYPSAGAAPTAAQDDDGFTLMALCS